MKKLIFVSMAIFGIILSSWINSRIISLCVVVTVLSTSNVSNPGTYSENCLVTCQEDIITHPCELDLTRIGSVFNVNSKADFMSYLNNPAYFPTPSARILEVHRLAVSWHNNTNGGHKIHWK